MSIGQAENLLILCLTTFYSKNILNSNNYELGYVTNKNGKIIVNNVKEIEEKEAEKKAEEEANKTAKQKEQEFKESCKKYTFEQLARNPDKMKDKKVEITGEVIQVIEGIYTNGLRVDITKSEYGWYEDTIYVTYVPKEGEDKILEDDIVTIWGVAEGEYSYNSITGATITLPYVSAEYLEIKK